MKTVLCTVSALLLASAAFAEDTADIYKAKCKACHGEDGKAQTKVGLKEKMNDFTSTVWQGKKTDAQIREMIFEGSTDNKKMKPFKEKLSEEEIDSLVTYIRQFAPAKK